MLPYGVGGEILYYGIGGEMLPPTPWSRMGACSSPTPVIGEHALLWSRRGDALLWSRRGACSPIE